MIFPVLRRRHPHICLEAAGEALMGIVTVFQSDLQDSAVRPRKLPGCQGHPAPGHISHDAVPHRFPEHPLIMIFGKVDALRNGSHSELLLNPLLYHVQGLKYRIVFVHLPTSRFLPASKSSPICRLPRNLVFKESPGGSFSEAASR